MTCIVLGLVGCESMSTPYVMKMDRIDQKMDTGNRGYLKGTPPPVKDRGDLKRPFIAIDIDLVEMGEGNAKTAEETNVAVETKEAAPVMKEAAPIKQEEVK